MTYSITAVVTGVGGGVGQSIIKGLNLSMDRKGGIEYRIVGTDADAFASGLYRTDVGYTVPRSDEEGYVERIVNIIQEENADILIPGSDPEVLKIAENRQKIKSEGDVEILVSPEETVRIGLDKWKTYKYLDENGFETPHTVLPENVGEIVDKKGFPVVVKPRTGSASRDLFIVTDQEELDYALAHSDGVIIQEYIIPEKWGDNLNKSDLRRQIDEYSTEVIASKEGEIVNSISNWRKMDKGIPSVAKVRPYDEVRQACEKVARSLDIVGPLNLQARITEKGPIFFELNTRFSGSTAVRCVAGFNGPDTMVRNLVLDEEVDQSDLMFENITEIRYKDEIYVSEENIENAQRGKTKNGGEKYDYY
jgi:carbamoyl-phosphate synthase large subunit